MRENTKNFIWKTVHNLRKASKQKEVAFVSPHWRTAGQVKIWHLTPSAPMWCAFNLVQLLVFQRLIRLETSALMCQCSAKFVPISYGSGSITFHRTIRQMMTTMVRPSPKNIALVKKSVPTSGERNRWHVYKCFVWLYSECSWLSDLQPIYCKYSLK